MPAIRLKSAEALVGAASLLFACTAVSPQGLLIDEAKSAVKAIIPDWAALQQASPCTP